MPLIDIRTPAGIGVQPSRRILIRYKSAEGDSKALRTPGRSCILSKQEVGS
jgi:hypothetical protein